MSDWGREQPAILAVHSWLEVQLMPVTGCVGGLSHHLATPWIGAKGCRPLNCTKDSFQLIMEWLHLCKDQCTEHFGSRRQLCNSFADWWLWVKFITAHSSGWVEYSQRWYPEPWVRTFKPSATANYSVSVFQSPQVFLKLVWGMDLVMSCFILRRTSVSLWYAQII